MPEKKDFVIKDKRIFAEADDEPKEKEDKTDPAKEEPDIEASEKVPADEQEEESFQLPEINFATFIFSLNSSVLMQLGVIEDPVTGEKAKNLPLAKQTIDILGMIEEKTKGNLTEDEAAMLKNILYELRMLYVREKG
ncbi:MAG: DUF1844 domain-containing protein [Desulfobacterales bacterium]|nr:MAG: DUF1844 domain-containing protein [Desulfobacterales bacterium]